jgi:hypothetical protein
LHHKTITSLTKPYLRSHAKNSNSNFLKEFRIAFSCLEHLSTQKTGLNLEVKKVIKKTKQKLLPYFTYLWSIRSL